MQMFDEFQRTCFWTVFGDLFWMALPLAASAAFATYKMHIDAAWFPYLEEDEAGNLQDRFYFCFSVLLWGWELFNFQFGDLPPAPLP